MVDELETTSTFKSRKVDLRKQGFTPDETTTRYALSGRTDGYVPFYDAYPEEVAAGAKPAP